VSRAGLDAGAASSYLSGPEPGHGRQLVRFFSTFPARHLPPIWREGGTGWDLARLVRDPVLRRADPAVGQGRPVLLIPGFLAGDDYRAFLGRQGLRGGDGPIVDEDGNELGRHDGYWRFTAGQRRGLGVAAAEPLYAVRTEPATNTVIVGTRGAGAFDQAPAQFINRSKICPHPLEHDFATDVDHVGVPDFAAIHDIRHLHARA